VNDKGRYRQFHAGLRGPFLSGLARDPNSNAIINSILKFLFAPDVSLRCLDRRVPKQKSNLFEFAAAIMAEACTSAAIMPHSA
jgi:hypothetical protein